MQGWVRVLRCNSSEPIPLQPGETVDGYDPQALLAPFFGTWRGPLAWRSGEATELTLTVTQDAATPLYRAQCPPGAYTEASSTLTTADGALNDTVSTSVSSRLPGHPYRDEESGVFFSGLNDSEWQGTVASHLPGLERYASAYLLLELEREPGTLELLSGVLSFVGEPAATGGLDTIEVATWRVE